MQVHAQRFYTQSPADVADLEAAIVADTIPPRDIVAIIGKTEGNGGTNDFTRELATVALAQVFARHTGETRAEIEDRLVLSFSGGTEGVTAPHMLVLWRSGESLTAPLPQKRLAMAVGYTRAFSATETGRTAMVSETARVVGELMREARIEAPEDVHLVQVKGAIPAFTPEEADAAAAAGAPLRSDMVHSRGASALGVGVALGEIDAGAVTDAAICRDWSLHSGVASTSAKPGLQRSEIVLFGNSRWWEGDLHIAHGVMQDIIDTPAIHGVLAELGLPCEGQLTPDQTERVLGIFAKSDADYRHRIRGRRHTMITDDDISDMRYSRCVVASLLAGVTGETAVYVSTRAEHHGPPGGGPVAIIARCDQGS
jgi:cyanuric acid amidohydrolase